jgi:hypothetical protein
MDYLDPKKEARHRIVLMVGYVLVSAGIVIATLILLYQAYGFGIGKNGSVIQNGLAFFSSQPHPANIYLNGKLNKVQTNARVALPSGIYRVNLQRDGYRTWQRTIEIEGGDVQHFDYPFLIPKILSTKKIQTYASAPGITTQSPDRRWLLVEKPGSIVDFLVYDLKSPDKAPITIVLPASIVSKATGNQSWLLGEWADDNKHLVLQHGFDGKTEYILVDREAPDKSQNLNTTLSANPSKLTLLDKKYDQYYLYDAKTQTLQKNTLSAPAKVTVQQHVLNYQSYGKDGLLYVSDEGAPAGKVLVKLELGDKIYPVRSLPAGSNYLLDLAKYSGTLYVVVGASAQDKAYVYMDPVGQLAKLPNHALVPAQVLHVSRPSYISFSTSAQFVMIENGNQFGVYDLENERGYNYSTPQPVDPPQAHATWMDGNRLTYVSGGKLIVFDYDDTNQQSLVPASSSYLPAFTPNYKFVYTLAPAPAAGQIELTQTSLLIPADQ